MKMDKYLTEQEENILFGTTSKVNSDIAQRDWAWMMLLRHTGIRIGSLAGLTIGDARKALVHKRLNLKDQFAKGGNGYHVSVNKKACMALRTLIKVAQQMGYTTQPDQALVMGRNHKGLSIRSFQARMKHWVMMSGLDISVTPHWFRHTCAMRIMNNSTSKNPLRMVTAALGHRSINSAMTYTQPSKEEVALALEEAS